MKRNSGFTLIELVIVIIVLGILAAMAVPKFINLQDDAKASAMSGVEAAIRSAAILVYSKSSIDNVETKAGQSVSAAGGTINVEFGYPAATRTGIEEAVELSGFVVIMPTTTVTPATVIFASKSDKDLDDICLLYTEAADKNTLYKIASGALTANAANCV